MALRDYQIAEIQRLIGQGIGQREICRRTGISRTTIRRIARGQRTAAGRDHCQPARRCPGCGGLVYGECLLCRLARLKHRRAMLRRLLMPVPKGSDALPCRDAM